MATDYYSTGPSFNPPQDLFCLQEVAASRYHYRSRVRRLERVCQKNRGSRGCRDPRYQGKHNRTHRSLNTETEQNPSIISSEPENDLSIATTISIAGGASFVAYCYLHLHIVLLTLSCKTINSRIDYSIALLLMGAARLIGMSLTFAAIQFVRQAPGYDTPDVIYFWMVPLAPHNLLSPVSFWIFYVYLISGHLRKGLGQWVYSRYVWGSRSQYQMPTSGLENLGGIFRRHIMLLHADEVNLGCWVVGLRVCWGPNSDRGFVSGCHGSSACTHLFVFRF